MQYKKLWHDDDSFSSFNLPYLRYKLNILDPAEFKIESHRADFDALVSANLLCMQLDVMEDRGILDTNLNYFEFILADIGRLCDWEFCRIISADY